ncbi:hypothetical protein [Dyella flagellata]|uniref:hypothetical protein n=1 Tax=Dyella flagellata TaxID=1867833 RepID=UPI0024E1502D|nr:hypothetical protein [Dyella flagellata]
MNRLLMILFLVLFPMASNALSPPENLYRYDYRPPSEISRTGFQAWGDNTDILGHLTGVTCGTSQSNSAYVSFGDSEAIIREAINESGDRTRNIWIYTIRATGDFFSARETLDEGMRSTDQATRRAAIMADRYGEVVVPYENEWVARGSVPVNLLVQAQEYAWRETDRQYMPVGEPVPLSHDAPETHANPDPIPEAVAFPPGEVRLPRERFTIAGLFTACLCMSRRSTLQRNILEESGNAPTADCPYTDQHLPGVTGIPGINLLLTN